MLRPYLKIWDWDLIFGRAVKAISSLGVRSPWGLAIMEITIRKPFETFRRENEYTKHGRRKQSYNK